MQSSLHTRPQPNRRRERTIGVARSPGPSLSESIVVGSECGSLSLWPAAGTKTFLPLVFVPPLFQQGIMHGGEVAVGDVVEITLEIEGINPP